MKEGILPLFDDSLADEVLLAMPVCNEYGIAGTTAIDPPPVPRASGRQPEQALSFGDASPEDPWSSNDEGEEDIPPAAEMAEADSSSSVAAKGLPCSGAASHPAVIQVPASPDSEQVSESVPPPMADADGSVGTPSWSGIFGDLFDQRWSFSDMKRPRW